MTVSNITIDLNANSQIVEEVTTYLNTLLGPNAKFKEDQLEAIISTITNHSTLVVEKTGWGKSLVYFIATKYFRSHGFGPSIIVSPLLSLMRNQKESANKLGLKVELVNGENLNKLPLIKNLLKDNMLDIVFITPEQLAKPDIKELFKDVCIEEELALFTVDEAHCISEWGHDFRLDFLKLKDFVNVMLSNKRSHVLATTATANNAVINDLKRQFGNTLAILRGNLIRESLEMQVIPRLSKKEKYAWLVENIEKLEGSGIIYCLTTRECSFIALWLKANGIAADSYYGQRDNREELERKFNNNEIKVLVATSALGMGYDKPDICFVIHFQMPPSILAYYQQIGRAGRQIPRAKAILFSEDPNDEKIIKYFATSSIPKAEKMTAVYKYLTEIETMSNLTGIVSALDMKKTDVQKILDHLIAGNFISKQGKIYSPTLKDEGLDEYIDQMSIIAEAKLRDFEIMKEFAESTDCYMKFICNYLDSPVIKNCNKCFNCTHQGLPTKVQNLELIKNVNDFLIYAYKRNLDLFKIEPRKKFPNNSNIDENLLIETGYFLSFYGIGLGENVHLGKYPRNYGTPEFDDLLVDEAAKMLYFLATQSLDENIQQVNTITYVPSLNHPNLVKNFAYKLAQKFNMECLDLIIKKQQGKSQKECNTSFYQCKNASETFKLNDNLIDKIQSRNIIIIDDMVDSKWTFTVCGMLLKQAGANSVTPFALANTANG